MTEQLLFFGGDIIPMTGRHDRVEGLLVRDGRVAWTGPLAQAPGGSHIRRVDLGGHTLLPAFLDAHSHLSMAAQYQDGVDLSECTDFAQIAARLKSRLNADPPGPQGAVLGINYDDNFLAQQAHPDRHLLDQVSSRIPVLILHSSSHMGVANTRLLELLGWDRNTPDPQGGRLGRQADGTLSGYLEETGAYVPALMEVFRRLPGDMAAQLTGAQETYLSYGITTAQEGAANVPTAAMLAQYAQRGGLKIDLVSYLGAADLDQARRGFLDLAAFAGPYCRRFRLGGYKLILDGSPQGRTAWLSRPYAGTDARGFSYCTDRQVYQVCAGAIADGRQLLAHCNGDAASEQFLTQYRRAWEDAPHRPMLRPVMIHCQLLRRDQMDRMKALEMIPSFFVGHTWYWGDVHLKNLGHDRGSHISPVGSALKRGLCYNFHQDTPVTKPDMLHSLWCAVNRRTRSGRLLAPEERIGVYDGLKGITSNAAYAYGEEGQKGTLAPGKLADLVILEKNPLEAHPQTLKDIHVLATYKEGRLLYQR